MSILTVMNIQTTFTLTDLCKLVDLPKRTIRYYIQMGLVAPPFGAGRGAKYERSHLEQLLEIRKWQDAGLSLERIRELQVDGDGDKPVPPPRARQPGSVEVWSHLHIDDGIELNLEPVRAGLTPEQARELTTGVMALYQRIQSGEK